MPVARWVASLPLGAPGARPMLSDDLIGSSGFENIMHEMRAAHKKLSVFQSLVQLCTYSQFYVKSPRWGLNPEPSDYKSDALPLSYEGYAPHVKQEKPLMIIIV